MAHDLSKVTSSIPIGGNLYLRTFDMDISNYDDDTNSDGESFAPADVNFRRFVAVIPIVVGGGSASSSAMEGVTAEWEEANNNIRLYHSSGADGEMAEMSSDSNEGTKLRLLCIGV